MLVHEGSRDLTIHACFVLVFGYNASLFDKPEISLCLTEKKKNVLSVFDVRRSRPATSRH